jgi:toxin ParE1/3/4
VNPPRGPIQIVWSSRSLERLREIQAFVARDKPDAAERLVTRIVAMVETLRRFPYAGRAGVEPGDRELVVGGSPYVVVYRLFGRQVLIGTIWHGAQKRNR